MARSSALVLATCIISFPAASTLRGETPGPGPAEPTAVNPAEPQSNSNYRIAGGVAHQLSADFDPEVSAADADFSMTRYGLSAGVSYPLSKYSLLVDHTLLYEYDDYNFSGPVPFSRNGALRAAIDPWDDSHLLSYSLRLSYRVNQDWSVFGGPTIGVLGESGADWSDAMTYGGNVGVRKQMTPDLGVGVGVIVASRLEDGTEALPFILLDWKLSDQIHLRNARPQPGLRGTAGAQLDWDVSPQLTLSAGFAYDRRRFRLDDSGVAPDGIAENSSFPVYVRAGYQVNENWSLSALAGMLFGGQLRLENEDGHQIGETDYDSVPFFGASAVYSF